MKEEIITYKQAKKLKSLGFDWPCNRYKVDAENGAIITGTPGHHNRMPERVSLPSQSVAARWFREVKGIAINVIVHDGVIWEYDMTFLPIADEDLECVNRSPWCHSYEEALSEGIDEALTILTENEN